MTMRTEHGRERARTARDQARAADPSVSAWVAANAGTGKTHVLTTRVLRLLLAGTAPERILCLTYTKAAAAEMSERVFRRLARWVTASEDVLAAEIAELKLAAASPEELARARDLFTVAIETPGGLKVQTIHAFCERLLQRFPLEAGIAPQFAILDEETSGDLARRAIDHVLSEAMRTPGSGLGRDVTRAVRFAVDDGFDDLLRQAIRRRDWIEAAGKLGSGGDRDVGEGPPFAGAEAHLRRHCGVRADATADSIDAEIDGLVDAATLTRAHAVLATGSKQDRDLSLVVSGAAVAAAGAAKRAAVAKFLLTDRGSKRERLMTKALAEAHPDLLASLKRAQERLHALQDERAACVLVEATIALLRLADRVLQGYDEQKRRRAALDFDDLIRATRRLLSDAPTAEWVLFKLDGGLDHILVDEAQDTARPQWEIIEALAGEFFAGTGAREDAARTVFAVGDEKQSIYGFQGAVPELFAEMGRRFAAQSRSTGHAFADVPLTLSFRSAAPVLETVDRVLAGRQGGAGVTSGGGTVRHVANRIGAAGLVEIWATEVAAESALAEVFAPLRDSAPASAVAALAERIAATIDGWLKRGEMLASEGRPVRAGDILVLVRRRRPFADAMVAALKARGIPVAGADRIRLMEQLAVLDLVVLLDFLLLPEDDLALATVLKSPLIGLDDDDLMRIAPGRRGSLWSALLRAADGDARYRPAAETLKRWRGRADAVPPFELLGEILDHDGMRARLIARLGPEAVEPIEELVGLALTYDDGAPPSLQGFVGWLRSAEREIKRDMEHGRNEVRVMTVHGAKGLEAPIVFLPDTCSTRSGGGPGGLLDLDAVTPGPLKATPFLWPVKGTSGIAAVAAAREAQKAGEAAERNRLLYVALTRARDRLYIAGFEGSRGRDAGCWYDVVKDAVANKLVEATDAAGRTVLRFASAQAGAADASRHAAVRGHDAAEPPDWARRAAPRETGLSVPMAPSRLAPLDTDAEGEPVEPPREARAEPAARSPVRGGGSDGNRFLRGTLTHALLEHLPTLPAAGWRTAAHEFVALRGADLKPRVRDSIVAETLAVLAHVDFAPLFGPGSRAEVPIVAELTPPAGKAAPIRVSGQIDRLVRLPTHVLIVDYKTNRPPPTVAAAVAEAYLLQLAAYRLAVARIFAPLPVRAALLWTEVPRIMEIPAAMLDAAETRLFREAQG